MKKKADTSQESLQTKDIIQEQKQSKILQKTQISGEASGQEVPVKQNKLEIQGSLTQKPSQEIKRKLAPLKNIEEPPQQQIIPDSNDNQVDFGSSDDSDDEILKTRIGKIPWQWYDNYKHFGYDVDLKKIEQQKQANKIDEFIAKAEDPNWWRTIKDQINQQEIVLTDDQLRILERIRKGKFANKAIADQDYNFEYEYDDPFPIQSDPPPKSRFMPSKWQRVMINRIVQGIQLGRIKLEKPPIKNQDEQIFDLWGAETDQQTEEMLSKLPPAIAAAKLKLPSHAQSYNPPEEFLFSKKQLKQWEDMEPEDRPLNFIPKQFDCLRHVEFYDKLINERFERCLDLYLCPRARQKKLDIDPESLIPTLPKPEDLRPFPTMLNMEYKGHKARIRCVSVFKTGQFIASCDEKGLVLVFEVLTSRIVWKHQFDVGICYSVQFSPENGLLAVSNENELYLINLKCLPKEFYTANQTHMTGSFDISQKITQKEFIWEYFTAESHAELFNQGFVLQIQFNEPIKFITYHIRGDYFATVSPQAFQKNEQVLVHCISKSNTQRPFSQVKGDVEKVMFHPTKPFILLLTQKHCFLYNLQKQMMSQKLMTGTQWNSCLDIHPYGDNIIIGSFDKKVCWFDLDLASTPYRKLQYHQKVVRQVVFHKKYPLLASCSDDCTINIFHAKVSNDLSENALIVPVKVLKGHSPKNDLGVLDIIFHPTQPWIFSVGSDHQVFLWT